VQLVALLTKILNPPVNRGLHCSSSQWLAALSLLLLLLPRLPSWAQPLALLLGLGTPR
jgi:hypothetical protein